MLSELVSNVVLHTADEPHVSVEQLSGVLRVGVSDGDPHVPVVADLAPDRVGGNGIRIVNALADRWGVQIRPGGGKTVWFEWSYPP